jgi:ABC-type spermidine/putrescine transport system permease subunit I
LLGGLAGQIGPWQIFVCVSHVDKTNTLMIINSISILTLTTTCITLVAFPFALSLCADDKKNEEERKI